ncbi:type VII secretion target [Salininema proteolyticum]|uniref:Type VII secretion target n=1 Tax=Salininema proteolyticum TaxID=1607685 RepID=A0ABV8TTA3_9ACTN
MAEGYSIDTEQVRTGAERYRQISEEFDGVAEYVADTDGDSSFFGVIGEPFMDRYYEGAEKVRTMIQGLGPAGAGLGRLMDTACETYETADRSNEARLEEIVGEIGR